MKMPAKVPVVYGLWMTGSQSGDESGGHWMCPIDDDGSALAYLSRGQAEHGRRHQRNLYDVESTVAVMCGSEPS